MRAYLKAAIFASALLVAGVLVSPSAQYVIQRGLNYVAGYFDIIGGSASYRLTVSGTSLLLQVSTNAGASWTTVDTFTSTGSLTMTGTVTAANFLGDNATAYFAASGRGILDWSADGRTRLRNNAGSASLELQHGTAPTCTSNCGTSPTVVGVDSAMTVTMGATGTPASDWVVTFGTAWPVAPSCVVQSALAGMVVGKMPIVAATTTTTLTVTTNGTAPANSDKYHILCMRGA